MDTQARCRFCKHYDWQNQTEEKIQGAYGDFTVQSAMCSKKNCIQRARSLCSNFKVNPSFVKYKCIQTIGHNYKPNFICCKVYQSVSSDDVYDAKEEAIAKTKEKYEKTLEKANLIKKELRDLQKTLGFEISYFMDGDTYGIDLDYQYIQIDKFCFIL